MASFVRFSALIALASAVAAAPPACLLACVAQVEKASSCSGLNDLSCVCGDNSAAVEKCLNDICPNGDADAAISAFKSSCSGYALQSASSSAPSSSAPSSAPSSSAPSSSVEASSTESSVASSTESSVTSKTESSKTESSKTVETSETSVVETTSHTTSAETSKETRSASASPSSSHAVTTAPGAAANVQLSYAAVLGLAGIALL